MADRAKRPAPTGVMAYVRRVREQKGIPQTTLADALGMTQSQYSGMERNRSDDYLPKPEQLAIIARTIGIPEIELVRAAGYLSDVERGAPAELPRLPADLIHRVVDHLLTLDDLIMEITTEVTAMADQMERDDDDEATATGNRMRGQRTAV